MEDLLHELNEQNPFGNKNVTLELDIGAIEGLKKMPVDMFDGLYLSEVCDKALVLCVDIRNFSDFLCTHTEDNVFRLIKEFTSNLLSCINQFGYGCSYYKLMGDGALVIWDETNEVTVLEAIEIFNTYTDFLDEELFKSFDGLGLAGALVTEKIFKYEISAEVSDLKYRDYVGYGINLACRLQGLATQDELILNELLAQTGILPYKLNKSSKTMKDLLILKGLMENDRKQILIYDRQTQG